MKPKTGSLWVAVLLMATLFSWPGFVGLMIGQVPIIVEPDQPIHWIRRSTEPREYWQAVRIDAGEACGVFAFTGFLLVIGKFVRSRPGLQQLLATSVRERPLVTIVGGWVILVGVGFLSVHACYLFVRVTGGAVDSQTTLRSQITVASYISALAFFALVGAFVEKLWFKKKR